MAELKARLNPAQRAAVEHVDGPLLVLAGAGSGKTRVLTARVANLIANHGVTPAAVLAVTFTNKAAGEMRDRITALLGARPAGMWVGTFHSICARILRANAQLVGRSSNFTIYDEDDAVSLIRRMLEEQKIDLGDVPVQAVWSAISDACNRMIGPGEYAASARDPFTRNVAAVYAGLEDELRANNAATFDDLLTLPLSIFESHADVLARYQQRFRYILVDEYQDTNRAQYRLIMSLGALHRNVCVVGDDDQSIYGWRGADIRNILDFEKAFPGTRVVRLEENYRSAPGILAAANAIIAGNSLRRGKVLRATLPEAEPVSLTAAADDRDEAEWVAGEIAMRKYHDRDLQLRHVAVIYRTNAQSRIFEEVFRKRGLAYRLVGALSFFQRREIKDLVAYLRLISNPSDDVAFTRAIAVPRRGVGAASLALLTANARNMNISLLRAAVSPEACVGLKPKVVHALRTFAGLIAGFVEASAQCSVVQLLQLVVTTIRYDEVLREELGSAAASDRLDNVRELASSAAALFEEEVEGEPVQGQLEMFLQKVALVAQADAIDPAADAVTLMTVHNAKGLEFPVVFIAGLEEGLFPLSRSMEDPGLLEEERRLLYVGVTRAERKLYLSFAATRRRNGELRSAMRSSFLRGLRSGLWVEEPTVAYRSAARAGVTASSYSPSRRATYETNWRRPAPAEEDISQDEATIVAGARVRHSVFGSGTVTDVAGSGRAAKVTVEFDDETVGRKRLVLAYAGLESGWDE
jgi:DNA helicase-2/ATP-dependent DNA helicase PcrA